MYISDRLISTIPIQELTAVYAEIPENIKKNVDDLKYNSIIIAFVKTREDLSGDNFAFMNPEKDIIFHRISKMDFLGDMYKSDSATYMAEVTFRENDYTDLLSEYELQCRIADGSYGIWNDKACQIAAALKCRVADSSHCVSFDRTFWNCDSSSLSNILYNFHGIFSSE